MHGSENEVVGHAKKILEAAHTLFDVSVSHFLPMPLLELQIQTLIRPDLVHKYLQFVREIVTMSPP